MEIKLTLAKILRNFEILSPKQLAQKPVIKDGMLFTVVRAREPTKIIFTKRN